MIKCFCRAAILTAVCLQFSPIKASAQIPNASFENWTDCLPDEWASGNVCGVMQAITKSSDAQSGSFAVRGEVLNFFGQRIGPVLQSGQDGEGFPISQRYTALQGSFKFEPIGGDRFGVNISFLSNGAPIATGAVALPAAVPSYTTFTVNMTYTSQATPDTAIIQFLIAGPVTGSDYHVGSVMFVDDLSFTTGGTGTPPRLKIERSGNSLIVSWPEETVGFKLQSTPTLNPATWTDVQGIGEAHSYQFSPTKEMYFRLIQS